MGGKWMLSATIPISWHGVWHLDGTQSTRQGRNEASANQWMDGQRRESRMAGHRVTRAPWDLLPQALLGVSILQGHTGRELLCLRVTPRSSNLKEHRASFSFPLHFPALRLPSSASFKQLSEFCPVSPFVIDLRHLCNSHNTLIQRTLPSILLNLNFSPGLPIHVSSYHLYPLKIS